MLLLLLVITIVISIGVLLPHYYSHNVAAMIIIDTLLTGLLSNQGEKVETFIS